VFHHQTGSPTQPRARQRAQLQWHQHIVLNRLKGKLGFFLLLNQLLESSFKAKVELRSYSKSLVQHSKVAWLAHYLTTRLVSRNANYSL
jgi:hypothetical protein